jgi:hypothetical protein
MVLDDAKLAGHLVAPERPIGGGPCRQKESCTGSEREGQKATAVLDGEGGAAVATRSTTRSRGVRSWWQGNYDVGGCGH